jgi:hypothetical protein
MDPLGQARQGLACDVNALDHYITQFAEPDRRRGFSAVDVLTDSAQLERILGYHTPSAAEVDAQRPASQVQPANR